MIKKYYFVRRETKLITAEAAIAHLAVSISDKPSVSVLYLSFQL